MDIFWTVWLTLGLVAYFINRLSYTKSDQNSLFDEIFNEFIPCLLAGPIILGTEYAQRSNEKKMKEKEKEEEEKELKEWQEIERQEKEEEELHRIYEENLKRRKLIEEQNRIKEEKAKQDWIKDEQEKERRKWNELMKKKRDELGD